MLEIFNDLKPFFENNYRRINVREYARLRRISPPSASKLLESLHKEHLLKKETEKNYIYYSADNANKPFIDLSKTYWFIELSELIEYIEKEYTAPLVILFGSFAKAEVKENSDIDIAIFTSSNKTLNINKFEKKLRHTIQLFQFKNREGVKNPELLNNIFNGFIMAGSW